MVGFEIAIDKFGLPVKCRKCGAKGFVKPGTNYGGWWRNKLSRRSIWYCPDHAHNGSAMKDNIENRYKTPEPEQPPEPSAEEELYKLLD